MFEINQESDLSQVVQIQARHFNCTLMRNNVGACTDQTGRLIRYGLGNVSKKQHSQFKSSDLIGITKVVITQEMVGKTVGIFTALEVKHPNWNENKKLDAHETAQDNFLKWVISNGGIASFINRVDRLVEIFRQ